MTLPQVRSLSDSSATPPVSGKMTRQQFKELLKSIYSEGEGGINRHKLREGLRKHGIECSTWRSWRAMRHADINRNKYIDGDEEVEELIKKGKQQRQRREYSLGMDM
ncbi:uncharacterized protein A4U43_C06F18150 [Asparagus officinalis]|uniref:EF-hand domain-containing protein n=1 Tax=Asparagus officinalis TaxID=4686 RepID=A0A5P1EMT8_ASPOF|nr:uncharacterized protein A4U43_C06F18150 [Asparagus officinalis]